MMAGWARVGIWCECISAQGHYEAIYGEVNHNQIPQVGERLLIVSTGRMRGLEQLFLGFKGYPADVGHDVRFFRPLTSTDVEADSAMFLSLVQRMDAIRIAELMLDEFEL